MLLLNSTNIKLKMTCEICAQTQKSMDCAYELLYVSNMQCTPFTIVKKMQTEIKQHKVGSLYKKESLGMQTDSKEACARMFMVCVCVCAFYLSIQFDLHAFLYANTKATNITMVVNVSTQFNEIM